MIKVKFTPLANEDIQSIYQFILEDSPVNALNVIKHLRKDCLLLEKTPEIGRIRDEILKNLRSLPSGRYVIFYQILNDRIEIIRILHGSRDITENFDCK